MRQIGLETFSDPTSVPGPPRVGPEESNHIETGKVEGSAPFILGEALSVVPAKLVKKIVRGEFVDMSKLLRDNM